MEKFTVEEMALMCIFDTSSRARLMEDLRESLDDTDDADMAELTRQVLDRLDGMSDAEFDTLGIGPEFILDEQEE